MSYRPVPAVFYSSEGVHLDSGITGPAILFVKPKIPCMQEGGICNMQRSQREHNPERLNGDRVTEAP